MPLFPIPDDSGYSPDPIKPHRDHLSPSETGINDSCKPQDAGGLRMLDENGSPDDEVVRLINSYLEKAFSEVGELSVGDRLGKAFLLASNDRETKSTTDEELRNAERYLYGLAVGAHKDVANTVAIVGSPLYEGLKFLAHGLKDAGMPSMENAMRATDRPTSQPSIAALRWADKGLKAGLPLDGERLFEVSRKSNRDMATSRCRDTLDMQLRLP